MVLIIFYRYMMNNRGILTPRAPYNGIQQSLRIFSRASFKTAKTRLFIMAYSFLVAPHLYTKIIKSLKGTVRVAVSKCTDILKNFFP